MMCKIFSFNGYGKIATNFTEMQISCVFALVSLSILHKMSRISQELVSLLWDGAPG